MTVATKVQALAESLTDEDRAAVQQFVQTLSGGEAQGYALAPGEWTEEELAQAQAALPADLTEKVQRTVSTLSTEDWEELTSWLSDPANDTQGYSRGAFPTPPPVPGSPLAFLLLATGGAVAGVLYAALHDAPVGNPPGPTPAPGGRPTR